MDQTHYHKNIVDYYRDTEHAYRDSWDLDSSLSIHYGYRDEHARNFRESLLRMNEIMIAAADIQSRHKVLDAGCGVGGSSIFLASALGCRVTGISLSERQVGQAMHYAETRGVSDLVDFQVQDYCHTCFPDASFDIIWGCESICYAQRKEAFIKEAFRLLKPGGRLIVADGFISEEENNDNFLIRNWLNGWQVDHLVTPARFCRMMQDTGFNQITHRDITPRIFSSAKRLYRFYFLAKLYVMWRKISFSKPPTVMQKGNIEACKYQFKALKRNLWQYGLITGTKPVNTI